MSANNFPSKFNEQLDKMLELCQQLVENNTAEGAWLMLMGAAMLCPNRRLFLKGAANVWSEKTRAFAEYRGAVKH